VAAPYVAASGTLVVTSDTGMPLTGTFRLRLGNLAGTILRVDSRAGTTLTVTVDEDDGNAAVGDSVSLVVTAEALLQLKADAIAGAGGGADALYVLPADFDPTAWTWANQGSATITKVGRFSRLFSPTAGGENNRSLVTAAPATPYTFASLMAPNAMFPAAGQAWSGLTLKESGTGKLAAITLRSRSGPDLDIHVRKLTNETTFSADGPTTGNVLTRGPIWFRIGDNGTNVTYEYSFDGVFWITLLSETRGTFFTTAPDSYGLLIRNDSGVDAAATFCGLDQT
jgi:hypothetical protein